LISNNAYYSPFLVCTGTSFRSIKRFWDNTSFFSSDRTVEQGNELVVKGDVMVTTSDSGVGETEL
jgi:hypothetical protein